MTKSNYWARSRKPIASITDEELNQIELCQTKEDFEQVLRAIREARDGKYPPDWYVRVTRHGGPFTRLQERIARAFADDDL